MRNWIGLVLIVCGIACTARYPESPTPASTLAGVRIHYNSPHTSIGTLSTVSLTLYAIDTEGVYSVVTGQASWFSSNTAVATVTNGTARGVANGTADIVATYQGYTSSARVQVGDPNAGRFPTLGVSFSPPEPGRTARLSARFTQAAGVPSRDVYSEAQWFTSDPRVFTVTNGELKAEGPGTASITASYSGATSTVYASVPLVRTLP
jgi:hypothetical protein